uniref:Uncharacterized protein n=1 Tax=Thermosporothrix sp. COM3 TaxID=2490863 RepID=A0A455SKK2_9CHLR|nr:hypothetical protein KTC_25920 [Thermosporothrix sp. COM3]
MKIKKVTILLFALLLCCLLAACGETSSPAQSSPTAQPTTAAPTPTPSPTPAKPKTADEILKALKAQGLKIGESFTYTEENDPNKLLGRPGQYTSKVNFKDTSLEATTNSGAEISIDEGGSIEVFENEQTAQKRFQYLQALSQSGSALFAEYEYIHGSVILRVSKTFTPTQAKAYDEALKKVL